MPTYNSESTTAAGKDSTGVLTAANLLYERSGFARCAPFGGYADTPFTHFYTKLI